MPPKTRISLISGKPLTPEQLAIELAEREVVPVYKGKKNKHPGINKNIALTTEKLSIEQIWPQEEKDN